MTTKRTFLMRLLKQFHTEQSCIRQFPYSSNIGMLRQSQFNELVDGIHLPAKQPVPRFLFELTLIVISQKAPQHRMIHALHQRVPENIVRQRSELSLYVPH